MAEPGSCWFLSRTLGHNSGVQRKSQNRYADYKRVYVRAQLDKKLNFGFFRGGARHPPKTMLACRRQGGTSKTKRRTVNRINIVEWGGGPCRTLEPYEVKFLVGRIGFSYYRNKHPPEIRFKEVSFWMSIGARMCKDISDVYRSTDV